MVVIPRLREEYRAEKEKEITCKTSAPSMPSATNLLSRVLLSETPMAALDTGRPMVIQTVVDRYMKEIAGARWAGSTTTCSEMNRADCAMPVPKPDGIMYRDSGQDVSPCQRAMRSRYDADEKVTASRVRNLYFPVLFPGALSGFRPRGMGGRERFSVTTHRLMITPDSNPPTALPTTAGTRCSPDSVLESPPVTWKYRGTENIICFCR